MRRVHAAGRCESLPRLCDGLRDIWTDVVHVRAFGLAAADDSAVWAYDSSTASPSCRRTATSAVVPPCTARRRKSSGWRWATGRRAPRGGAEVPGVVPRRGPHSHRLRGIDRGPAMLAGQCDPRPVRRRLQLPRAPLGSDPPRPKSLTPAKSTQDAPTPSGCTPYRCRDTTPKPREPPAGEGRQQRIRARSGESRGAPESLPHRQTEWIRSIGGEAGIRTLGRG